MSFRVSDGIGSGTPGRLTPLCELTVPPTSTSQRARPLLDPPDAQPHGAVVDQHVVARAAAPSRAPAGAIGRSPSRRAVLAGDRRPPRRASSSTGAASSPTRSFGPCRSAISATGRPVSSCAARIDRAALGVVLVRAVREVEPRRRRSARISGISSRLGRRGRPDRRHDLRPAHARLPSATERLPAVDRTAATTASDSAREGGPARILGPRRRAPPRSGGAGCTSRRGRCATGRPS